MLCYGMGATAFPQHGLKQWLPELGRNQLKGKACR